MKDEDIRYAINRYTDGAPPALIMDELIRSRKVSEKKAPAILARAVELLARAFDEEDYSLIRACAFAGDSYRQQLYRTRIDELLAEQRLLKEDPPEELDTEARYRLYLAMDRSIQAYATLSLRGRRDLPVAFAPKKVLQNEKPPTDEELNEVISGSL